MDFNELRTHCVKAHVSTTEVAKEIDLSYDGLKKGLNNGILSLRYVLPLCNSLGITPNQFFGVKDNSSCNQVQNGGIGNSQTMYNDGMEELRNQLKKKDEQIGKLLDLLAK